MGCISKCSGIWQVAVSCWPHVPKNEMSTGSEEVLARKDLFLNAESLFPIEANLGSQASASIARILRTWNIAADAVVFVDDNPMELGLEAQLAHPGITCLRFPGKDAAAVWNLLGSLRDAFGKPVVMEEDKLRLAPASAPQPRFRRVRRMRRPPISCARSMAPSLSIGLSIRPTNGRWS